MLNPLSENQSIETIPEGGPHTQKDTFGSELGGSFDKSNPNDEKKKEEQYKKIMKAREGGQQISETDQQLINFFHQNYIRKLVQQVLDPITKSTTENLSVVADIKTSLK